MTIAAIAEFILKFGPAAVQALPTLAKLAADIRAGRGQQEATEADWAELTRLSNLTAEGIYKSVGVVPPP